MLLLFHCLERESNRGRENLEEGSIRRYKGKTIK